MNIGAIGTSNYDSGYHNSRAVPKAGTKSFGDTIVNNTTNIVIHGCMGEKTEAGDTVAGAWGNAVTGTSATVYKPQDFDENNPVYYMKIWDKDGNVTERTVGLNEIDPKNCNSFDMYAIPKMESRPVDMRTFLTVSDVAPNILISNEAQEHLRYTRKTLFLQYFSLRYRRSQTRRNVLSDT